MIGVAQVLVVIGCVVPSSRITGFKWWALVFQYECKRHSPRADIGIARPPRNGNSAAARTLIPPHVGGLHGSVLGVTTVRDVPRIDVDDRERTLSAGKGEVHT